MALTPEQQQALHTLKLATDNLIAIFGGATTEVPTPTSWLTPQGTKPTVPIDGSDEQELCRYAVWGYKMDLTRGVDPGEFPKMLALAGDLLRAPDPATRDRILARAGQFPAVVAAYLVLTGCTQGFSPFLTPTITAPASIQTVRNAALYAAFKPFPGGPGPGVG